MAEVLITENIVGSPMTALGSAFDVAFEPALWQYPDRLAQRIPEAKALIVRNQTQVTAELIRLGGRLQIIARAGAGLDNIDVEAATAAGVVLSNTPMQNAISVAELTVGLMLALARKIPAADRHVKDGGWDRNAFTGTELYDKTLGVLGFGRIGFLTARRAAAFGMNLTACDPLVDPDALTVAELRPKMVNLEQLLARADFLTCHLPSTETTQGLLDYDCFCRMKPTAFFVNVARGDVVEESGLLRALEEGKIAGAALDVRQHEPPQSNALDTMANVILIPHIAAFTDEAQHRVVAAVCRDVEAVLRGGQARHFVNFPAPRNRLREPTG